MYNNILLSVYFINNIYIYEREFSEIIEDFGGA